MTIPLRLSTASQEIPLGRFANSTDGNSEEVALTIANTDIKLWKAATTTLASKNSGGATHMANGIYYAVLDATDTNTLGALRIFVHVSGALAEQVNCIVYPAAIWDAIWGASGNIPVDVASLQADVLTAAATAADFSTEVSAAIGTLLQAENRSVASATASTVVFDGSASAVDDYYNGRKAKVFIRQGTGAGQDRFITDYVGSTKTATVSPDWDVTPDSTSKADIRFV